MVYRPAKMTEVEELIRGYRIDEHNALWYANRMRDASLTVYSDMIQIVETRGKRMKESESEQAGDGPPDETTLQEIAERVTRRYPSADVGVMWVWPNGRGMYYFRWDEEAEKHAHVDRLDPEESRVLVAMAYSGLQAEKELLKE